MITHLMNLPGWSRCGFRRPSTTEDWREVTCCKCKGTMEYKRLRRRAYMKGEEVR
jgi:hypothetical protein